jgi:hypothetical protein
VWRRSEASAGAGELALLESPSKRIVARWKTKRETVETGIDLDPRSIDEVSMRLSDVNGDTVPDLLFLEKADASAPLHRRVRLLVSDWTAGTLAYASERHVWRYVYDANTIDDALTTLLDRPRVRCSMYEAFMAIQLGPREVEHFGRKGYDGSWQRQKTKWKHGQHPYAPPRDGREVYTPNLTCSPTFSACTFSLSSGDTTIPFSDADYFLEREKGICVVSAVAFTSDDAR